MPSAQETGSQAQFPSRPPVLSRHWEHIALALVLCVAVAFRLWNLTSVPPGLTHDEAAHGQDALRILDGARPIYQTVGYGREPLYDYLLAAGLLAGGPSVVVLRLCSAALNVVALVITYAWMRRAFDVPSALLATAFQSVSFWSISTSRQVLRSSLLPALFSGAVYLFWLALPTDEAQAHRVASGWKRYGALALFAVLLGATLYTYVPARGTWVVFPMFLCYLVVVRRPVPVRVWLPALASIVAGLLLSYPMFAYIRAHPGVEQRLGMVDAPLLAWGSWDVAAVLRQAVSGLGSLFLPGWGDGFLAYNIPGRPALLPWTAVAFIVGLALCVVRWRESACALSVIWFLVGMAPALLTGATASFTRSIAALPVVYVFPAIALVALVRWAWRWWGKMGARWAGAVVAALVVASGAVHSYDYFVRWAQSPDTRAAYQATVVRIADYLNALPGPATVVISSVYPQAPHDPYILALETIRSEASTRWVDARSAIVLPSEPDVLLIAPSSRPMDSYFADLPGLRLRETVHLRADDLDPSFTVYDWQPHLSLEALLGRAQRLSSDHELPIDFGGAVSLVGIDTSADAAGSGATLRVATIWEVTEPARLGNAAPDRGLVEVVLFTHALDLQGTIVAQEDRLDAPSWDWQPGDTIIQIHRLSLPDGRVLSYLMLEIGVYRPQDMQRIPVLVEGVVAADRVLVGPVETTLEAAD